VRHDAIVTTIEWPCTTFRVNAYTAIEFVGKALSVSVI